MINIFREMVKDDEFLSLSCEKCVEVISYSDLAAPFEEKIS